MSQTYPYELLASDWNWAQTYEECIARAKKGQVISMVRIIKQFVANNTGHCRDDEISRRNVPESTQSLACNCD